MHSADRKIADRFPLYILYFLPFLFL